MKRPFCFLSTLLLLASCAKVGTPDGGPKDILPPKVVSSSPDSAALNVKTSMIVLSFDENIQTREIQKNLFISPALEEDPKVNVKGKRLEINLSKSLDSNTTYIFQFIDGIADLNEGNVLSQHQLSFSTGPKLDTFSIHGTVRHILDGLPEEALVLLYANEYTDSLIYKKPIYISKSDKNGNFNFTFLKKQNYRIIAFEDKNKNRIPDPDEPLGGTLSINDTFNHTILLSVPRQDLSALKSLQYGKSLVPGRYFIQFNQEVPPETSISIKRANDASSKKLLTTPYYLNSKGDTLYFFPTFEEDTLNIRIELGDTHVFELSLPSDTSLLINQAINIRKRPKQYINYLEINTLYPVLKTHSLAMQLIQDSTILPIDSVILNAPFSMSIYSSYSIDHDYRLILLPGALSNYSNVPNTNTDTLKFSTRDYSQNAVGLKITHPDSAEQVLIQLFNEQKTYTTILRSGSAQFYDIEPGTYRIRSITDINKNGRHDGIQSIKLEAPENVFISSQVLEIKPEWDYENVSIHFVEELVDKRE